MYRTHNKKGEMMKKNNLIIYNQKNLDPNCYNC